MKRHEFSLRLRIVGWLLVPLALMSLLSTWQTYDRIIEFLCKSILNLRYGTIFKRNNIITVNNTVAIDILILYITRLNLRELLCRTIVNIGLILEETNCLQTIDLTLLPHLLPVREWDSVWQAPATDLLSALYPWRQGVFQRLPPQRRIGLLRVWLTGQF